jgi:single-stranded-DNA-specific exonuclease
VKLPEAIWAPAEIAADPTALLSAGHTERIARLLARRGIQTAAAARSFLVPALDQLHPGSELLGLDAAVDRLDAARERGERVAIVGDYDVDGVAATALLAAVLRSLGVSVETLLPRRDVEGYGFQPLHARQAAAAGCSVIVTVDCGIQAHEAASACAAAGLDLIVTDHHLPGPALPAPAIVLNPRQPGCSYPYRELTGAGLALKLGAGLLERAGRSIPWEALLRIACLGTIADVAPLTGENRVIAALGLAALADPRSPGLRALLGAAGIEPPVRASDVGFRLGPRLNAAGRLDSPEPALELLLTRDPGRAGELVELLDRRNRERQAIENRILEAARRELAARDPMPGIVVLWSEEWHRGVVGVAAGRLARELSRPAVLLASDGDLAVGSGRGVPGISIHDFLAPWAGELERFGGHAAAIGLTARADRLPRLRESWERAAAAWPSDRLVRRIDYDSELEPGEVGDALFAAIAALEPFGAENPEPLFRIGPLRRVREPRTFGGRHVALRAAAPGSAAEIELVGWGWAVREVDWREPFEVLGHLDRDRFRGEVVVRLVDQRPVGPGPAV